MTTYKITSADIMNGKVKEIKIVQCESFADAVKIARKMEGDWNKTGLSAEITEIK